MTVDFYVGWFALFHVFSSIRISVIASGMAFVCVSVLKAIHCFFFKFFTMFVLILSDLFSHMYIL